MITDFNFKSSSSARPEARRPALKQISSALFPPAWNQVRRMANRFVGLWVVALLIVGLAFPISVASAGGPSRHVKSVAKAIEGLPVGTKIQSGRVRYRVVKDGVIATKRRASDKMRLRALLRNGRVVPQSKADHAVARTQKTGARAATQSHSALNSKNSRRAYEPLSLQVPAIVKSNKLRSLVGFFIEPGNLRASLMGLSDGVASTFGLVAATTAMSTESSEMTTATILLAGIAAMFSGASSMASGEYSSVSYDNEQIVASRTRIEKAIARKEFKTLRAEILDAAEKAGVVPARAKVIAKSIHKSPERLKRYVEELDLDASTSSARAAAASSFVSFLAGSVFPMAPLVFGMSELPAVTASGLLSVGALVAVGSLLSRLTGAESKFSPYRLAAAASLGAAISWGAGALVGVWF